MLATVAVALDHKLGARKRTISGQLTGRAVTRAKDRRVWLDATEYAVEVTDEGSASGGATLVPDGNEAAITVRHAGELIALKSAWKPGEPVWSGSVNGAAVAVQARGRSRTAICSPGVARMRAPRSTPSARPTMRG